MPSIGWSEMLMLAMVAIIVVGPKELPRLMRVVGQWMGKARAAAREFQKAFDDLARESEVEEMRRKMDNLRKQAMSPYSNVDDDNEPSARRRPAEEGNGTGAAPAETQDDKDQVRPDDNERPDDDDRPTEEAGDRAVSSH